MDDGYEHADINLATISPHHGVNIERVSDSMCRWNQTRKDGICMSDRPLQKGDNYEIKIQGCGCVMVGLTSSLPSPQSIHEGHQPQQSAGNWFQIKLKYQKETISVECSDKKKIWMYQTSEGKKPGREISITEKSKHYIIVNALFGNLDIDILSKDEKKSKKQDKNLKWCKECGLNVLVQENGTKFNLRYINPLGFCALEQPLMRDTSFSLKVLETYGSWHYLCLGLSNWAPRSLALDDFKNFYENQHADGQTPWPKAVVPLLKLKCPKLDKWMSFKWQGGNSIRYIEDNGNFKNYRFTGLDITQPIYVYFEPFRHKFCVDSRVGSRQAPGTSTYLTPIKSGRGVSEDQPSSQTVPLKLYYSKESDPNQTFMKQVEESPDNSTSQTWGPPAFNLDAYTAFPAISTSQALRFHSDPQENTLNTFQSLSLHENTCESFQQNSDPKQSIPGAQQSIPGAQQNGPGGQQSIPGAQQSISGAQQCRSGYQQGILQEEPGDAPLHDTVNSTYWPDDRPLPPPPVQMVLVKSGPPLPTNVPEMSSPPSINLAQKNADIGCNILTVPKKDNSFQKDNGKDVKCEKVQDSSNQIQNKYNKSREKTLDVEYSTNGSEKLAQSTEISSDSFMKSPENKIPTIPTDFKLERHPKPPDLSPKSVTSDQSSNHRPHHRALSEQGITTQWSNVDKKPIQNRRALSVHGTHGHPSEEKLSTNRNIGIEAHSVKSTNLQEPDAFSCDEDEEKWKSCLQGNFTMFLTQVHPIALADKLFEKRCLTSMEYETIFKTSPWTQQCREIMQILQRKPRLMHVVLYCLDQTDHKHIADKFRSCMK